MDLKQIFAQKISQALNGALDTAKVYELIEKPKKLEMGDLAFPCFTLAKTLRQSPGQIAEKLASSVSDPLIEKVEAVGPYVNLFLDRREMSRHILQEIVKSGPNYGANNDGNNGVITVDLSSPNIAKPFSMGHLRSTVIGNAIANIAEKNGYRPVRINYLGDWGTQFGKLIVAFQKWGNEDAVKQNPIPQLLQLYVRFHEEAKKDPSLEEEGRRAFLQLEKGDVEAVRLWKWFREESLKEFSRIYDLLEVSFDSFAGEAFYNDKMDAVVHWLQEKNLLVESEGALVVPLAEEGLPPCLIQKSDGATLYATRDLAAALYRKQHHHFTKALYVVGREQSLHFKQIQLVLKKAGIDWADDLVHIPFGLILQDGKKMSTRKGKIVLLEEVLKEAIQLAQEIIEQKNPNLANKDEVARQVGIGAVIFHDLKHTRTHDIEFSLKSMLNFDGETGPYVQYTHARAQTLLRKGDFSPPLSVQPLDEGDAWPVLSLLDEFGNVVRMAMKEYDPSKIARYALDLSRAFNQYYAQVHILSNPDKMEARLTLVYATATVLAEALRILGIRAPKEM